VAKDYQNLRVVSDACLKTGRAMWVTTQVNSYDPKVWITTDELRFQAYSAMAFGAESLTWACYTAGWWENQVVDKDGNICPWAEDQICFIFEGEGGILGTDNGCQTSMERFTSPLRRAFFGKCLVVVKGKGSITAKSAMLKSAWIEVRK
jgi:hypothetical protein